MTSPPSTAAARSAHRSFVANRTPSIRLPLQAASGSLTFPCGDRRRVEGRALSQLDWLPSSSPQAGLERPPIREPHAGFSPDEYGFSRDAFRRRWCSATRSGSAGDSGSPMVARSWAPGSLLAAFARPRRHVIGGSVRQEAGAFAGGAAAARAWWHACGVRRWVFAAPAPGGDRR